MFVESNEIVFISKPIRNSEGNARTLHVGADEFHDVIHRRAWLEDGRYSR